MPDLTFRIDSASVVPFAAVPMIAFQLQMKNRVPHEAIHTVALRCQIQIEVTRRRYTPGEQEQMLDLFGQPDRWSQTLRSLLWTHVNHVVPTFAGSETVVDMQVPCSFDFNVAATKYFYGLEDGEIPLCLMFSGTVFATDENGALQVSPIPWDRETRFRVPFRLWKEMMDSYYPNTAWLCLQRDVFDRVHQYKTQNGIATWEKTLDRMLTQVTRTP